MSDGWDLERFVAAQALVWDDVAAELHGGRKRSHWMWFVFPQLASLGRSATARHYGIASVDEARAYAAHPLLGARLVEACRWLLALPESLTAHAVFGSPDDIKLRSCLTLFERAWPAQAPLFGALLDRWYGGERDPLTLGEIGG